MLSDHSYNVLFCPFDYYNASYLIIRSNPTFGSVLPSFAVQHINLEHIIFSTQIPKGQELLGVQVGQNDMADARDGCVCLHRSMERVFNFMRSPKLVHILVTV